MKDYRGWKIFKVAPKPPDPDKPTVFIALRTNGEKLSENSEKAIKRAVDVFESVKR